MRALATAALLALASAGQAQPPGKSPFGQASPPERVRWEYAELFARTTTPFPREGDDRPKATVALRWTTDKDEVTFKSWAELARHVKAEVKDDATPGLQRIQALTHLGNEGWELAESSSTTTTGTSRTMLFERRVR